ncbi:MAG TPA: hypothetical protein VFE57_07455 [Cyclobacteriaceae bacterium]|nr:hypothetical protein [Cyclobacteriaceae bacterium]
MERSWKIVIILFFLIMIVVFFVTTCNNSKQVKRVMEKLDSTKMVLDSANAHVDSSKKVVHILQTNLNNYADLLNDVNDNANTLISRRVTNKTVFITQANKDSARFEELKKQVMMYMKDYWPEITADTLK